MTIDHHKEEYAGRTVVEWTPGTKIQEPAKFAYRIGLTFDESDDGVEWSERLEDFLQDEESSKVEALIVGAWGSVAEGDAVNDTIESLVVAHDKLTKLKALFVGDIIGEECEISWLVQGDLSALYGAFPKLEHFGARGGNGLSLGNIRLPELRSLVIETGGMSAELVREVAAADLPKLEHMECWLGTENYGANFSMDDLAPILDGKKLPSLRYLGLRNSEKADEIAEALKTAPVMAQLEVLDLSMGTLSDAGAEALISNPGITRLKKLILDHHYLSNDMMQRVSAIAPEVSVKDQQEADVWNGETHRFVAVGE